MTLDDLTKSSGEWLRGTGPESDIVMCSRIRLARNLADFPFTNRASRSEKTEIEAHFRAALSHARLELTYLDVNTLGMLDRANNADSTLGKLAAKQATDPEVKEFAMMMMKDHHDLRASGEML